MNLFQAHDRLTARISAWDSDDVRVGATLEPGKSVVVRISSATPATFLDQRVELRADGSVVPGADAAGSPSDPVEQAVRAVEEAVSRLVRCQAEDAQRRLPRPQPAVADTDLAEACAMWQGERVVGPALLRGAARALTGIPHFFRAAFLGVAERNARRSPEALRGAVALLRAVNGAGRRDADGWNGATGLPARGFAGMCVEADGEQAEQIRAQLRHRSITVPLWDVSLDKAVAERMGHRFSFEIVGAFPAVPAWQASGLKPEAEQLITGGRYGVLSVTDDGGVTHARLQWIGAAGDAVGSDALLLGALGRLDGVWRSELVRTADGGEKLTVRLPGEGNWAQITHLPDAPEATVQRFSPPQVAHFRNHSYDYASVTEEEQAVQEASVTSTVPADVASIVAAVLADR